MAARGARATGRSREADRRPHDSGCGRSGRTGPSLGARAGTAGIRLDHWPQRADRHRWGAGDAERYRRYAAELVALAPDVILVNGPAALAQLQQATRSLPIVFTNVTDPVGAGFVVSVARPGGNATGFMLSEYSTSGKWLELLKEIAPRVTRAATIRDPTLTSSVAQFAAIQSAAASLGVELSPIDMRNTGEIERTIAAFARAPNGGLIVTTGGTSTRRSLIVTLAARHRLPAVYPFRYYVADGGLISYGPDPIDPYRRAAGFVDRILKGEKPADLPVQPPTNSSW